MGYWARVRYMFSVLSEDGGGSVIGTAIVYCFSHDFTTTSKPNKIVE
jgi:hypothetical protein